MKHQHILLSWLLFLLRTAAFASGSKTLIYRFVICLSLTLAVAFVCFAAPGDLDSTFGVGGKVVNNTEARAMTLQADGKIIVAGRAFSGQFSDLAVVRYNPDGSLDSSFGTNGRVIVSVGANSDFASAVLVQADGKIIVAGYTDTTGAAFYNFAVVRLNPSGSLDTTFDGDGKATTAVNNTRSAANAAVLQPNGKIILAGSSGSSSNANFALVRYNSDGSLDSSFDADGQVTTPVGAAFDSASTVAVQPDGKIVAAGQVDVGSLSKWGVVRYNANGSLDLTFDGDGKLVGSFRTGNDFVSGLAPQPDGRIILAGGSQNTSSGFSFALARLTSTGAFDTSFDGDGIAITPVRLSSSAGAVALQTNGKIVAAGYSDPDTSGNRDFAVVRYSSDGALDASFGTNGVVTTDIAGDFESAYSLALQTDGKLVVAGEKTNGHALARYLGDPAASRRAPLDFDGDGRTDYGVFRPSQGIWYFQNSQTGFAAARWGLAVDQLTPADFDGDGKTDVAVYRSGVWYLLRSQAGFVQLRFGLSSDIPVPFDFDGDGKADIAVYRPSVGEWWIRRSSNEEVSVQRFGLAEDKPVPADFDGDGRADIAVYRPSTGIWYILQSTLGLSVMQFGVSTDKPALGDYDGDGKADIAIYRPADGNWWMRLSATGNVSVINFGLSNDKPVAGDYDGDGRVDIAVWRDADGVFYVLQSGSGNQFSAFRFGLSGDLPLANAFVP